MWSGLVGWCMFWLGWVWLGRVWSGWVGSGMVGSVRPAKSVEADRMMGKHGRKRHGNDREFMVSRTKRRPFGRPEARKDFRPIRNKIKGVGAGSRALGRRESK